jgi:hypothetical protein
MKVPDLSESIATPYERMQKMPHMAIIARDHLRRTQAWKESKSDTVTSLKDNGIERLDNEFYAKR